MKGKGYNQIEWLQFCLNNIKLNLRSLNEVNVGEQVSKMVVVRSRAPTGRICIRYVIQKCALLGMQYVYCATRAKMGKTSTPLPSHTLQGK